MGVSPSQAMPKVADTQLQEQVASAIKNDPLLSGSSIEVKQVHNGAVRLEGYDLAQDPGETKDLSKGPGGLGGEGASPAFRDALGRARARLDAFVPGR